MPAHSHAAPPRPLLGARRARFAVAAGFILAICAAAGAIQAQLLATPFSQSNVPLASLASQVQYTIDMSSLPARPRLIVEAIPDAAHADMELELQISNCTIDNPVAPGSTFFCPSPVSTPNEGLQTVSFDAFFCETATTIPAYPGETCRVTVRALDFGAAGAPATFNVAIRGDTIVPTSTTSAEVTTNVQTISIAPTKDTTLYQTNTGSSNGLGESFWTQVAAGTALNSLLAFNVQANVPAGSTILDAWIDLQVLSTSGTTPAFELYAVPRNPSVTWVEGSANAASDESTPPTALNNAASWSHRHWTLALPAGAWTTPGGDRQLPALQSASVSQTGLLRLTSASLLSHIRAIHTNTTTYDGLLLLPTSGAVRFASDEHLTLALRPRLHVEYVAPVTPVDRQHSDDDRPVFRRRPELPLDLRPRRRQRLRHRHRGSLRVVAAGRVPDQHALHLSIPGQSDLSGPRLLHLADRLVDRRDRHRPGPVLHQRRQQPSREPARRQRPRRHQEPLRQLPDRA